MNFDRNTVIGFVLIATLFFGYFYFNNKEQASFNREKARQEAIVDSIAKVKKAEQQAVLAQKDTLNINVNADSLVQVAKAGNFKAAVKGSDEVIVVENEVIKVAFTTKGGQPKWVELKRFKGLDSNLVKLAAGEEDKVTYPINTGNNSSVAITDLLFSAGEIVKNADNSTTITFSLNSTDSSNSTGIQHIYTLRPNDYLVDFKVKLTGANHLLEKGALNLTWDYTAASQEKDFAFESQNTQISFIEDGDFDYYTVTNRNSVSFSKQVDWLGVRQRFFNTFFIAKNKFDNGKLEWKVSEKNKENSLLHATANMRIDLPVAASSEADFALFYGPADYKILKKHKLDLEDAINMGQGPYAFVRPLNKYVVMPVWDFIKGFVSNYGIVIALLTLFIRLLISPLSYKSYLSGAKMKALRPEIAVLKEKYKDDQQAFSMEQMKLFREAGVNPLGGCIPALLQIPIFFALYSFFNSSLDLRGAEFLWANDLSAPDDILKFGFSIPILGDHISIFTLTATLTSLLISLYSMSMNPDQSNPMLKYMPYIFPFFLLFIFNNMPSALTWYYTVSNIVTLIIQFVIQNYIIDQGKVLAKIEENKKKPKTKSKWQERLEQMQEQQKQMQQAQKNKKK